MVNISHLVEKIVNDRPLLFEAIQQDIISFGNLAEQLEEEISKELQREAKRSAIVMALRRYAEKIRGKSRLPLFNFQSEITLKTNLCDIAVSKSTLLPDKLQKISKIPDYPKGDTLNIIHGNYEVSIITNIKHLQRVKGELKGEAIMKIEQDLVALSLRFSEKFLYTPGVIASVVQKLNWEDINIFELISTYTELTFLIAEKDSLKGYTALQRLTGKRMY